MKVGIIGAGPIGLGYAALLANGGHEPVVWSPRDSRVDLSTGRLEIATHGAFTSRVSVRAASSLASLEEADVVIFCVVGNAHRTLMELAAPHLHDRQAVLISSHCSLGGLYLSKLLAHRACTPPILAIATTVMGGALRDGMVHIPMLRNEIDVGALPVSAMPEGINLLRSLFGDRFTPGVDLLAITLSNLNPQIHLASAILNFTRMEKGERWDSFGCITECVGRLVEVLDQERLAIASAFGVRVRTVRQHYLKSYEGLIPGSSVHEMAQLIGERRAGSSPGPATLRSRYLTEDLPFGIASTIALGRVAMVPTPLHEAGLALVSAACGHDFHRDNDLLPALDLESSTAEELRARVSHGWSLVASR